MSAKIRFITRLVWDCNSVWDWSTMTSEEIAEKERETAGVLAGIDYDGMGHYVPIIRAASEAWDAAIEFAACEVQE